MGKLLERFRKFKTRERVLLIVSIIVLFYIGIDRIVVTPFLKSINETKERLETQKKLLKKYYSFVHRTVNKLIKDGVITKEKAGKSYLCSINLENEN